MGRSALLGPRLRRNLYKAMPEEENAEKTNCVMETANNAWNKPVIVDGKAQQVTKKFFGSSDSGSSNSFHLNKAKKSVAMKINISQSGVTVMRQPKGPTMGSGFNMSRMAAAL